MNKQPTYSPEQEPTTEPRRTETPDRPEKPSKPTPRRKFILPTFTPGPAPSRIDYRTFLREAGIQC